jgi:hypothetical protein
MKWDVPLLFIGIESQRRVSDMANPKPNMRSFKINFTILTNNIQHTLFRSNILPTALHSHPSVALHDLRLIVNAPSRAFLCSEEKEGPSLEPLVLDAAPLSPPYRCTIA